jgi:hypothetical protein
VPTSNILYALAQRRPALLDQLLTQGLQPSAALLLTQMFDRLPGALAAAGGGASATGMEGGAASGGGAVYSSVAQFFQVLYGACADPDAVLQRLLEQGGKLSSAVHRYVLECCN